MNKGLDLIQRQQIEIIDGYPTGNIFIGVTREELTELEIELKEHEQYKAIEEELGIDLVKIFTAFKNNLIYAKNPYGFDTDTKIVEAFKISIERGRICGSFSLPSEMFNHAGWKLADYGKTWALTREELERKE